MKEINKQDIEKSNSWPIVEAKKILKERKSFIEKKGKIVLQTGYGPSGLPHIGTFGEVARTSMVVNALNLLTDLPKKLSHSLMIWMVLEKFQTMYLIKKF